MFCDYSGIKLKIKNRKKFWKFINMWKLNNILLNNQWVKNYQKRLKKKQKKSEPICNKKFSQ